MAYNKPRRPRYRFEEEEKPKEGETETTTEEGGEESTPDSHEQLVNTLVEMGLSADQAEAVHQMALDLINAGGSQEGEATQTEMSRARRRRRAMARRRARGGRTAMSARRRPARGARRPMGERQFSASPRRGRRPAPRGRREMGADNRTQMMLRRQRREIAELKSQLQQLGAQPAARPERARGNFSTQPQVMPSQGNVLDRVKSFISQAK